MKKILIALALCLVLVSLIATPVFAATQKADLWKDNGLNPAGYATFITNQGDEAVTVLIKLTGAEPKTKFYVYLAYRPVGETSYEVSKLGSLTTNSKGNWGGQNTQYDFKKVLPKDTYEAALMLETEYPWVIPPTPFWIYSDVVQFRITN